MYRHFFSSLVALCVLTGSAWSQTTDAVPLKNWHAPLAWQATSADEVAAAKEASSRRGESQPQVTTPDGLTTLGLLVAITPCRLVDTRQSWATPFGGGASAPLAWAAGSTTTIPAPSGSCSLPAAMAYSANITVIPSGSDVRWLTAFPTGATMPVIATLTGYEGGIVSNAAVIPADPTGSFNVYVKDATEVVIDVNGYYISPSALALGAGTAAAPSLTFSNDTNSGVYSPSAGTVTVTSAGTDILSVNSSGVAITGTAQVSGDLTLGGSIVGPNGVGVIVSAPNDSSGNTTLGISALVNGHYYYPGTNNTAIGGSTLSWNLGGSNNTAVGAQALNGNEGSYNTAIGAVALQENTGANNTAGGWQALYTNTGGNANTAFGANTLFWMGGGSNNIALGYNAGLNIQGSNNIDIGNNALAADSGVIRIGTSGTQTATYIAGVVNVTTGQNNALAVVVDSNGQLGTVSSSRRGKHDIADMGDTTETIMNLRPVRFRYNVHGNEGPRQYGLIAEEVAEVSPDLVARNKDGEIETVFYDKINAMLLNQVQTQQRLIEEQNRLVQQLETRVTELENRVQ
jgi:hypothetical protein